MSTQGRTIIVTGASSGIGAALAKRLAGFADHLVLHARSSKAKLEAVAAEVEQAGTLTHIVMGDLNESGTGTRIVDEALERFGNLDALVANAGFPVLKSLEESSLDDVEAAFRGNLFSFFELARTAQPYLEQSESGRIVAVGSFTSHVFRTDIRQFPVSAASKGALETAVRSLAMAMSNDKTTVNCVVPGFIQKDAGTHDGVSAQEQLATESRIPLGRFGKSDEVAAMIEFLLSKEAGYITGQCIHVNGGLI